MNLPPPAQSQPAFNVPAPVVWLIAGLVAAHVVRILLPNSEGLLDEYGFIPALWDRIIPYVSSMALHGDFTHLGINLLWLLAFGPIVARRFGTPRFFLFFVVCGVAGALAHLVSNWGSSAPAIGASAAISGLMAAAMRMMPVQGPFGRVPANDLPLAPLWSFRLLSFSAVWLALNALMGVTGFGTDGEVRLIAWEAHMGGYIAGYLLAGPFDRWAPASRHG